MSVFTALMAALVAAAPPPGGPPAATAATDSPRRDADLTYADLADLVLSAPIIAKVGTIDAIPVREAEAAGGRHVHLEPGEARRTHLRARTGEGAEGNPG